MEYPFQLIDVFYSKPFLGNPVAVVFVEGLPTELMQQITRWLNLSETVFVLPPTSAEADYKARIFTLDREMPFAGHPTLGACCAWLHNGGVPRHPERIVLECGIGLVQVRNGDNYLAGSVLNLAHFPLSQGSPGPQAHMACCTCSRLNGSMFKYRLADRWSKGFPVSMGNRLIGC